MENSTTVRTYRRVGRSSMCPPGCFGCRLLRLRGEIPRVLRDVPRAAQAHAGRQLVYWQVPFTHPSSELLHDPGVQEAPLE
jgi:hypothetical protein